MTVLTAELTHFNLVIHLSKLQQLALLFSSLFRVVLLFLLSQGLLADAFLQLCSRSELPETSGFAATFAATLHHVMIQVPGRLTTFRCDVSFF